MNRGNNQDNPRNRARPIRECAISKYQVFDDMMANTNKDKEEEESFIDDSTFANPILIINPCEVTLFNNIIK